LQYGGDDKSSSGDNGYTAFIEFLKAHSIQIDPKAESNISDFADQYDSQ